MLGSSLPPPHLRSRGMGASGRLLGTGEEEEEEEEAGPDEVAVAVAVAAVAVAATAVGGAVQSSSMSVQALAWRSDSCKGRSSGNASMRGEIEGKRGVTEGFMRASGLCSFLESGAVWAVLVLAVRKR